MVPDRLNFLFTGPDEWWWLGDVIGRFSLLVIDVVWDASLVIIEEDKTDAAANEANEDELKVEDEDDDGP